MDILLVADIHSGSTVSPVHPKAKLESGMSVGPNNFQKRVLRPFWREMCKVPVDRVVTLGDMTDGRNRKDEGCGIWTSDLTLQTLNAALLLRELNIRPDEEGYKRIDAIGGSGYHIGSNPSTDQLVCSKINELNDRSSDKFDVKYHGMEFILSAEKCKVHFSHKMSTGFYQGTALNRELMYSYLYQYDIDGMIRAHIHHYHLDSDGRRFAVSLPGWKGRDKYLKSFGLKYLSQIGWVVLRLKDGDWSVHPTLKSLKNIIKTVKA